MPSWGAMALTESCLFSVNGLIATQLYKEGRLRGSELSLTGTMTCGAVIPQVANEGGRNANRAYDGQWARRDRRS